VQLRHCQQRGTQYGIVCHGAIFPNGVVTRVAEVSTRLTQAASIVAKSRSEFYFRERLVKHVSQKKIRLHGRLDGEMFLQLVSSL
jgi:hypothetical protein